MAKKQEAEKELKAKEAELDVVSVPLEKETIESEADSINSFSWGTVSTSNSASLALSSFSASCFFAIK